jgi:hypothetical protein
MADAARQGRATRSGPDVRERILDAAIESWAESGISGLTQTQVAKRAGVRQSHLRTTSRHATISSRRSRSAPWRGSPVDSAGW